MFKSLIKWMADRPVFANVIMITFLIGGFQAANNIQREVMPQFSSNVVEISIGASSSLASEVETSVCVKVEEKIKTIASIDTIDSIAGENGARILIQLKSGENPRKALDEIQTKVAAIQFPKNVGNPRFSIKFQKNRVMQFLLYWNIAQTDPADIRKGLKHFALNVRDELLELPDINDVRITGIQNYQIAIEVSKATLEKYNLTFSEIANIIRRSTPNVSGGLLHTDVGKMSIYTKARRYTGFEYGNLVIRTKPDGTNLYLRDVAVVKDDLAEGRFLGTFNGKPCVHIRIFSSSEQDIIKSCAAIRKYYAQKQDTLPPQVKMVLWSDLSKDMQERLAIFEENAVSSMLLVFFSLWVFLRLRISLWVTLGIPVSFAGGFIGLWMFGQTLNSISLFGFIVAIGIVVDDAIVVSENIDHHQKEGKEAAVSGAYEVFWPVVTSTFTTIATFFPMLFVSGKLGKFVEQIPLVIIAVLVTSLIESLFILPSHLSHIRRENKNNFLTRVRDNINFVINGLREYVYKSSYLLCLRYTYISIAITITLSIVTIGMLQGGVVHYIATPQLDNDLLEANVVFPIDVPLEQVKKVSKHLEDSIKKVNDDLSGTENLVKKIFASISQNPNSYEISILAEIIPSTKRNYHSNTILDRWREYTGEIPEVKSVTYSAEVKLLSDQPLRIRLLDKNMQSLRTASEECKNALAKFSGVYYIEDDSEGGQLQIVPKLKDEGRFLGVSEKEIAQQLQQGFSGQQVVRIQRSGEDIGVTLRYPLENRVSIEDLESVMVRTSQGNFPLNFIANLEVRRQILSIRRENLNRKITIAVGIDQSIVSAGDIIEELKRDFFPQLQQKYPSLKIVLGGGNRETKKSINSMIVGFQYTVLVIFIVLSLVFRSYMQTFLILAIIPFSAIGMVFGHWLLGQNLSSLSLFGIIALAGVILNDSILLIDTINKKIYSGLSVEIALQQAGPARFRAIVLTTFTTFAGLVPIMFSTSISAQFIIPMAISLGFGLIFATFLQLYLIPVLFLYLNTLRRCWHFILHSNWPSQEEVEPAFRQRFAAQ